MRNRGLSTRQEKHAFYKSQKVNKFFLPFLSVSLARRTHGNTRTEQTKSNRHIVCIIEFENARARQRKKETI